MAADSAPDATDLLQQSLAELRSAGRHESTGSFSLDLNKSLEKLSMFQLEQPRRYVHFLVAAACARGASYLQFELAGPELVACFDGEPFRSSELLNLFYTLFEAQQSPFGRSCNNLAFALNATRQLGPRFVVFDSNSTRGCNRIQLSERLLEVAPLDRCPWTDRSIQSRFHLRGYRDLNYWATLRSARIDWAPTAFCPIPLWVNGKLLASPVEVALELWDSGDGLRPAALPGAPGELPTRRPKWSGGIGLAAPGPEGSLPVGQLHWIMDGLAYLDSGLNLPRGLVVWVYVDEVKVDLSRSRLVLDESLAERRKEVQTLLSVRLPELQRSLRSVPSAAIKYGEFAQRGPR